MRSYVSRSRGLIFATVAAALIFAYASPSSAQSAQSRRDERRADMEMRQRALRTLEETARRAPRDPDTRPSYRQVAEDFEQLQLKSHLLSVAAAEASGPALDYKQVNELAAEVKRRASKLKQTLALPGADEDKKKKEEEAPTPESLRAAIASLDESVKRFAWNPTFRRPDVVDLENSTKARRDLEEILRLSARIAKSSQALGRTSGNDF